MFEEDKRLMIEAYSLLYEIETIIMLSIVDGFRKNFGYRWQEHLNKNIDFDTTTYRKLINYFKLYKRFFPHVEDHTVYQKLYNLFPIRNKICHMRPLTQKEFQQLKDCHQTVTELFSEQEAI